MENKPKISFVMPTRNRREWVGEALQSLLTQTIVKNCEIVVVNDASTDETKDFLDNWASQFPEVKVIHNETQQGGGKSRNIGMEAATGEIIGVCDDDDIYADQRAELILKHFELNPESELVNFPYQAIGYYNERIEDFEGKPFDEEGYKQGKDAYFCNPSVAYKKKSAQEVGGYEAENNKETDDAQFLRKWIDAGKKVDFQPGYIPVFHRILPGSMMSAHRGWRPEWVTPKEKR